MKYCRDCKHGYGHRCYRQAIEFECPVLGFNTDYSRQLCADSERKPGLTARLLGWDVCGPEAKYFEQRQPGLPAARRHPSTSDRHG